jgi:hypothetical protein
MKATKANRRRFLVAAGLGGAGAVAAVVVRKQAVDAPQSGARAAGTRGSGYRVTEHIEKYYKTTAV